MYDVRMIWAVVFSNSLVDLIQDQPLGNSLHWYTKYTKSAPATYFPKGHCSQVDCGLKIMSEIWFHVKVESQYY